MEYFSALKKIEITIFASKLVELENIIQSEITHIQTDKCCKLYLMCRIDEILSACVLLTGWPYKGPQCLILENGKACAGQSQRHAKTFPWSDYGCWLCIESINCGFLVPVDCIQRLLAYKDHLLRLANLTPPHLGAIYKKFSELPGCCWCDNIRKHGP